MNQLLKKLKEIQPLIGKTPYKKLEIMGVECILKLEYNNFSGSIKDRAAFNILHQGIKRGEITDRTTIVESSSGNFAIAIGSMCKHLGLNFIGVIDPNINSAYEEKLKTICKVVKVTERDETGGFLLTRLKEVKRMEREKGYYWTNQYANPDNYLAYYNGLGNEMDNEPDLNHAFVAVSSCGTITGLSLRLKEIYPEMNITGVDIEGSLVFQDIPMPRHVSGLGSSLRPSVISKAKLDRTINLSHAELIRGCWDLREEHGVFGGGSTGASYMAIKKYIENGIIRKGDKVLFLCCDTGVAYQNTIYNDEWTQKFNNQFKKVS